MYKSIFNRNVIGIALLTLLASLSGHAEDIDIFVGGTGTETGLPNILFVLDNSANWSRNDQHWEPKGVVQGQAEVRAIRNALSGLTDRVNVGLMLYATNGPNTDSGYVRHAIKVLNSGNQAALNTELDRIYGNINNPIEHRPANPKFGDIMQEAYNYLSGGDALQGGAGTPSSLADADAYRTTYSRFESPLSQADICVDTYIIFIGNTGSSGPTTDSTSNSNALAALVNAAGGTPDRMAGASSGSPIPIPKFDVNTTTEIEQLGYSTNCYGNRNQCTAAVNDSNSSCRLSGYASCACSNESTSDGCSGNDRRYKTEGTIDTTTIEPTGVFDNTKGKDWNLDDWVKFFYQHGVPIPGSTSGQRIRGITYTIDVFNKKRNDDHTSLLMSAARVGGGSYFFARNQASLEAVLNQIISDIISVNSTFASASLPISATSRAQNENQVFIGMFRPEPFAKPRWYGNLKRYQIVSFDGVVDLADASGERAVNLLSGFVSECASSFWTTDSGSYWSGLGVVPDPRGQCQTATQPYSDKPDGPFVEKGGTAQMLRRSAIGDRKLYTRSGNSLVTFNTTNTSLDSGLADYTRGMDIDDMDADNDKTEPRPTIHGDIVHSRPLPLNHGSDLGITVYYGANGGALHAIDANSGSERWSFIAPEHFSKLERLRNNQPLVAFPNQDPAANPLPKDYFFDGSIGQIVTYDEDHQADRAWIFPTMRRGGRMLYSFDVTSPSSPSLKWAIGCPNLANDTGCTSGLTELGQTWSIPNGAYLKGYGEGRAPVLVMGGGYDGCEDADSTTPSCGAGKGRAIYVLDAATGAVLRSFQTERPVPSDISLVDLDHDGYIDLAYAADTGGNIYRISFIDPVSRAPLASSQWSMLKIARTQGGHRKFLYGPATLPYRGTVYLALGSGNRERPLETNYPYVSQVEDRFYVFLDTPLEDPNSVVSGTYPFDLDGTSSMFDRTINPGCTDLGVGPGSSKRGWSMSFPGRGEQTVTNAVIVSGMATFSTSRPGGTSLDVCARPIGVANGYWVNLFNGSGAIGVEATCGGSRSKEFSGGGLPPSPVLATVPIDGKMTTVLIGATERRLGALTSFISVVEAPQDASGKRARTYWSSDVDR